MASSRSSLYSSMLTRGTLFCCSHSCFGTITCCTFCKQVLSGLHRPHHSCTEYPNDLSSSMMENTWLHFLPSRFLEAGHEHHHLESQWPVITYDSMRPGLLIDSYERNREEAHRTPELSIIFFSFFFPQSPPSPRKGLIM